MAEARVSRRVTEVASSKGSTSVQEYLGSTQKTTTSTPSGGGETRVQNGEIVENTTRTAGNVTETRTSNGISKTTTQLEDKGVVLRFRIQIQQRNPIVRQ